MKRLTYQFSNVSEVWVLDATALRPISVLTGGVQAEILPPISDNAIVPFAKSINGQPIPVRVGLARVGLSLSDGSPEPEWRTLYEFVRQCFLWIRAATRQYWVGTAPSHQANSPTALLLTRADGRQSVKGLGAVRAGIRWVPLTAETWEAIETALRNGWRPSIPEQFFLDASLYLAEGNAVQAVAGMGIACEVELNGFLDDLIGRLSQDAVKELYKVNRSPFSWKLEHLPQLLGASPFSSDNSDRVAALREMYERRGTIVHRGYVSITGQDIARYWFSAEEFFEWSRNERIRLGIWPDLSGMYRALEKGKTKFSFVFPAHPDAEGT